MSSWLCCIIHSRFFWHQRPSNAGLVRAIARLLGLPADVLTTALVTTAVAVPGDSGVQHSIKPLAVDGCVRGRDALARGLYQRLVSFLTAEVHQCDVVLDPLNCRLDGRVTC